MRLIYIPEKEIENTKKLLSNIGVFHLIVISSEYGKYKQGDFVKTVWGEKLVVHKVIQPKTFKDFEHEITHHQELKQANMDEIKILYTHKKIEILELKKYR